MDDQCCTDTLHLIKTIEHEMARLERWECTAGHVWYMHYAMRDGGLQLVKARKSESWVD